MQNFQGTKTMLRIVTWAGVGLALFGVFLLFAGATSREAYDTAVGIGGIAAGLSTIIFCQIGLAQVETATNTGAIREMLAQQTEGPQGPLKTPQHASQQGQIKAVKIHNGVEIVKTASGFTAGGEHYYTLAEAEKAIDSL